MKSFLSFVLAIVLAFSCIGCVSAEGKGAVTIEAEIGLDKEQAAAQTAQGGEVPAETKQMMDLVGDLLGVAKLRAVVDLDQKAGQLELTAENETIISIGLRSDGKGISLASSLLGDQVLFMSSELMKQFMQQASSAQASAGGLNVQELTETINKLDKEQFSKEMTEVGQEFVAAFQDKIGQPEPGEYEVDGMMFTARTPVNLSYVELMEILTNTAKSFLSKESIQPVLKLFSKGEDVAAKLDKDFEDLKKKAEEQKTELSVVIYTDDNGSLYCVAEVNSKAGTAGESGQIMRCGCGSVNGGFVMNMTGKGEKSGKFEIHMNVTEQKVMDMNGNYEHPDGGATTFTAHAEAGSSESVIETTRDGQTVKCHTAVKVSGESASFESEWFMNGNEKALFFIKGSVVNGGELTLKFDGDDVAVLPIEKLMSGEDTSAVSSLSLIVMGNLAEAVNKLARHMPENTGALLTTLVSNSLQGR